MNSAVGSPANTSPMERRRSNLLSVTGRAVNGLAVAALLAGATLVNAQTPAPAAAAPSAAPATAPAKKPAAKGAAAAADTSPKGEGSYAIGVSVGENLRRAKVSADMLSIPSIAQGIRDSLGGKVQMSQEYQTKIMTLIQGARSAAAEPNHAKAAAFLAENAKKKDVVTTASGLQYKVLAPGAGESPKPTDQVSVNYKGTLLDGTEFDASSKHPGGPAKFEVNRVIPGWQEALVLMKPGAKYQLWIPPKLAYDLDSPPMIPPGSLLQFEVELVSISPPTAATPPAGHPMIPPPQPQQK
jgi:FKBP-type peptidyl-prolyl cis-trans isomerase